MAGDFTQANRRLQIETPLGPDALLITALSGTEGVSTLFHFQAEMLGRDERFDFDAIVGENVTISIDAGGGPRFLNGFVSRFSQSGTVGDHPYYNAEIVPWLWFLTRTADCRVFQKKSVPDILKQLFGEYGFSDFRFKLSGSYDPREYCVQYRETDYNFIARLLEEEGISYFFAHENGKHTLVLADSPSAYVPCPILSSVRLMQEQTATTEEEDVITWFTREQEVRTGRWSAVDYNFETPSLDLSSTATGHDSRGYEIYDHPTGAEARSRSDQLVRVRQEEEDTTRVLCRGTGYARSFAPGFQFSMRSQGSGVNQTFDGRYLLTAVQHRARETYGAGADASAVSYENDFECIDVAVPPRPARRTRCPVIFGVQTATVVGPADEEIFTDKYGRVKVQFHWDREGKRDENSSCWLRVAHPWAGKGWGFMTIPRVGQEVVVQFLEGNPDRPIIVGSVYNGENTPFYKLPDYKTLAYVKSNSSKGGKGFNELRFEDKKGDEQVFIHSQKRMDVRVKGSLYETVHGNRNEVIGWKDGSESGGEHAVTVGGSYDLHINQDQYQRVEGVLNESVVGNVVSDFEADAATMVGGKYELNAKEIVLEAANKISLKVGGNFVVIDITGVTIFGTTVRINSGGAGTPTGDHGIDDPLDAATSDTGEPGYLERLRRSGGGGGGGRRHRTLHSQHAPARRKYATPPTLADITSDPYVDAELKRAFEDSNPNAPDVPNGSPGSQKHEQGGWVVWNKNTGELEVVRVPPGDRDGLGTIVGTRPPDNADQQTVGWFHTHPNKASEGYGSGPSPGDTGFQNGEAKVPGIIETHDGQKTIPYP